MIVKTRGISVFVLITAALAYFAVAADIPCTSENCYLNTTLIVGNSDPIVTEVQAGISVTGTAESFVTVNVLFNVTDYNGYIDLNHSTAQCEGYKSGEAARYSNNCTSQEESGNNLRYNCSVDFQYFDAAAADWRWNCSVSDNSDTIAFNDSVAFTINALNYVDINASTFAWPSVAANTNDQEAGSALNLDNGGNQDYETAAVTAYNATYGSNVIPATAFYLNNVTGDAVGTQMTHNTSVNITSWFTLKRGNESSEDLFAYVDMPGVPSGTYTSTNNWLMSIST